jgi:hypothetical protein
LSVAALALLAFAGAAAAQDKSPALLNTLEVQQLVKRAEPGDNARLAAHFTSLAERHVAEAKRHTSMAQSFVGNPSRNLGTGMSAHCKQLADLNTQSAGQLRELASYHQLMSALVLWSHGYSSGNFDRRGVGSAKRTEVGAMAGAGQPAKVGADSTTREQRASRDVAAGWVGKALKAKILWAGVA